MFYEKIRPFIPVNDILIPKTLTNKKNIAFILYPENNNFLDFYNQLNFR